jgi:hypothetical protein
MSTRTITYPPKQLSMELYYQLPEDRIGHRPHAPNVVPLDTDERRCAAYRADHYWIWCCCVAAEPEPIPALEEAFKAIPGVYRTTQVYGSKPVDPDWPLPQVRHRDYRPQVWALMRDPVGGAS